MKVFFDECVPRPLRNLLTIHEIYTAQELGWGRLKNGDLILRAEQAGFAVFLSTDKNLRYQQNLKTRKIALLVLSTNYWPVSRANSVQIAAALSVIQPSEYRELLFDAS
jgi:hypothetical protein